jgi:BirA family transcriptional regulator, biotin operon repressor / biotin---[acetyl-CoA-carboxylase] ligase
MQDNTDPLLESARALRIERFAEIDSTSGHARALIATGRIGVSPVAFVAGVQTNGVGRFRRAWSSPRGGLWLTLAWPAQESDLLARLDGLGLRIGVACLRVVRHAFSEFAGDPRIRLKWPNDVLVQGRKVLGVLTEVVHGPPPEARPWILVGVGLNANVQIDQFPESVRSHATTLLHELGREVSLDELESRLLAELLAALNARGLSRGLLVEAVEFLHGLDRDTTVSLPDGTRVTGVLTGLNDHGMAVLDVDGRVFVPPLGSIIMSDAPAS